MIISLSYPITIKTPLYPNTPAPVITELRSQEKGDSANTSTITYATHSGTHVDAPSHFCKQGNTIADCVLTHTSFFPAYCIDIPKQSSTEINTEDLKRFIPKLQNAEALLIRTGWHIIRSNNPEMYCSDHPWVSPEVPQLLREHCPCLKLFGIDQISISSVLHREVGHICHRKFLCEERPIIIAEDLNLADRRIQGIFRLHIFPIVMAAVDGSPVIAIAETEHDCNYLVNLIPK